MSDDLATDAEMDPMSYDPVWLCSEKQMLDILLRCIRRVVREELDRYHRKFVQEEKEYSPQVDLKQVKDLDKETWGGPFINEHGLTQKAQDDVRPPSKEI